ncbi:MAG: hypothetical protein J7L63_04560, partial [Thermoplasmata archaeon]|nr:hypothetical protein [Thermoplasmata archaeon]
MRGTAENPFGKGVSSPKSGINYFSIRDEFSRWIHSRVSKEHARKVISYLDRFAGERPISTPKDVFEIKSRATSQKYIVVALRNLLNFAEEMDLLDEVRITKMRKVLKVIHSNPDNFIPSTETVKGVYKEIDNPDFKLLFEILACSGLRIIEAVQFLKNFEKDKLEYKDNFARYPLFSIRHTKK